MDGSSGDFLARLLGVPAEELAGLFRTASLLHCIPSPPWRQTGPAADLLMKSWAWRSCPRVILLGRDVGAGFGLRYEPWLEWFKAYRKDLALLPYPSGMNRWWNEGGNRQCAADLLYSALGRDPHRQGSLQL